MADITDPSEFKSRLAFFLPQARALASSLLSRAPLHFIDAERFALSSTSLERRMFTADFAFDAERFALIRALARDRKAKLPMLLFEDGPVPFEPFDLVLALGPLAPSFDWGVLPKEIGNRPVEIVPSEVASEVFERRLGDFIACRMVAASTAVRADSTPFRPPEGSASVGDDEGTPWGGGALPPGPGAPMALAALNISVHTRTSGLRVHYSPAYGLSSVGVVFGHPTTPVVGPIRPGLWRFGVMGATQPLVWDPGRFDIPPMTAVHLTVA